MSMMKCPECEKEISSNAQICPNCGNPINLSDEEKNKNILKSNLEKISTAVISIVITIAALIGIYYIIVDVWKGINGNKLLKSQGIDIDTQNSTVTITQKDENEYEEWFEEFMNWLGFEKIEY